MRKMFSAKQIKEMAQKPSIYVKNITKLTDDEINGLDVGDVVAKKTGKQLHCYIVTYKQEKHGICLSYFDGSGYIETISYDYTAGHWVYNSKDVFEGVDKNAPDGTLAKVFGIDSNGDVVKGVVSGGKKLYKHSISIQAGPPVFLIVISSSSTPITSFGYIGNLYSESVSGRITGAFGGALLAVNVGAKTSVIFMDTSGTVTTIENDNNDPCTDTVTEL